MITRSTPIQRGELRMPTEKDIRKEAEDKFKAQDKKIDRLTERVTKLETQLSEILRKP